MKFFAGLFALFSVVMTITSVSADDECPVCYTFYRPVCAQNINGEFKTFRNMCQLKADNCNAEDKHSVYIFVKEGACDALAQKAAEDCSKFCTSDYHAVCAQNIYGDYKTFPNMCMLNAEKCRTEDKNAAYQFVGTGECKDILAKKTKDNCPIACTEEFHAVCAQNLYGEYKTFPNLCMLQAESCRTEDKNAAYQFVKDGECPAVKSKTDCMYVCTDDYRPVCAQNAYGEFKTFPNMCGLKGENCGVEDTNAVYTFVKQGECQAPTPVKAADECPKFCPANYRPVCGQNIYGEFKAFPNMCMLNAENCKIEDKNTVYQFVKEGECQTVRSEAECFQICTEDYSPVCGKNIYGEYKTFDNKCILKAENCRIDDPYAVFEFLSEGVC